MTEGTTRVTIREAAGLEGVGEGAIRKRIERGTLRHDKGADGRVYVYLSTGHDTSHDAGTASGEQLEDLRGQLGYMRQLLDAEREANRENRRIIAALAQRIPEIEPPEPRGRSEEAARSDADTPAGESHRTDDAGDPRRSQEPEGITDRLRRWLRRP